ncbi:hypothetical protein GGE07_006229 [Sinorhizobium terangae]|nr:hypothetical protein [Sinorhizobium terangae]
MGEKSFHWRSSRNLGWGGRPAAYGTETMHRMRIRSIGVSLLPSPLFITTSGFNVPG